MSVTQPTFWDHAGQCNIHEDDTPALPDSPLPVRPKFHGATFDESRDRLRLTGQLGRVYEVLRSAAGQWMTMIEIQTAIQDRWPDTNDIITAISARIRQLRTECGVKVEKENRGGGTWVYRIVVAVNK